MKSIYELPKNPMTLVVGGSKVGKDALNVTDQGEKTNKKG